MTVQEARRAVTTSLGERRGATTRFVLLVLGVYTLFRLVTTMILVWVAHQEQDPSIYSGEVPRYFEVATLWDGAWYQRIAEDGYPPELPRDSAGEVRQNEWAFYPMFPYLARWASALTGQPFEITGPLVATVLGGAAAVVMGLLLRRHVGPAAALAGVSAFAAFPTAPTLQVAYTESLAVLLLCLVLWALSGERWLAAAAVALLTGLARPIALPLGLVALVAVLARWVRRREEPLSVREVVGMLTSLAACAVSGLIWPVLVWRGTEVADGYTVSMSAWRQGEPVRPFLPTLERVQIQFGETAGPLLLAAVAAALVVAVVGPWARGLGLAMRTWCLGYPFYLVASLDPWTSIYRYLLPLFPLFVLLVGGGWRAGERPGGDTARWELVLRMVVLCVLFLGWQWWWTWELFRFEPPTDNPP